MILNKFHYSLFWISKRKRKIWAHIFLNINIYGQILTCILDPTPCPLNSKNARRARRTRFKYLLRLIATYASSWLISIASEHPTLELFLAENYFTIKSLISPNLSGLFFKSLSTRHFPWTSLAVVLVQAHVKLEILYFNISAWLRELRLLTGTNGSQ